MTGPLSLTLRSVTCLRIAKQPYTKIRDKTSAGKKTRAYNVKRNDGRLNGYRGQ